MKFLRHAMGLLIAQLLISPARAGIIIEQHFSSAPNAFGSPSFAGWAANALSALLNDLSTVGDRSSDPAGYERLILVAPGDMMVTSLNSWRGVALPSAPFDGEFGNRLHAGLHITGTEGSKFRLNELSFAFSSSDGSFDFSGDFVGLDFNCTTRYGITYGGDGAKGGGDDQQICGAGSGLVVVDELVYVGVGNAFWPGEGNPFAGQDELSDAASYILESVSWVSSTYCITGYLSQAQASNGETCQTTTISVPEPSSLVSFGSMGVLGLLSFGYLLRRNHRAA